MKHVMVVGQTPPPYGGQAKMTQRLVSARFEGISISFVRMAFSRSMAAVGKAGPGKLLHMLSVILRMIGKQLVHRAEVLYYMPVGNSLNPLVRDIVILLSTRWMFRRVVFHFRAAGVSDYVARQKGILRKLAMLAYRDPDLAIQLSDRNPNDGEFFGAKRTEVVWNGLEDMAAGITPARATDSGAHVVRILYVGIVSDSKGIWVLLEAFRLLRDRSPVELEIVGEAVSRTVEESIRSYLSEHELADAVCMRGVLLGDDLRESYQRSDIFCFPSFFESESFGNVAVEAMMFGLPVVATDWRGIPDIVIDEQTGLIVPIKDSRSTAEALGRLVEDPGLRLKMGEAGRLRYETCFQLATFEKKMGSLLRGT